MTSSIYQRRFAVLFGRVDVCSRIDHAADFFNRRKRRGDHKHRPSVFVARVDVGKENILRGLKKLFPVVHFCFLSHFSFLS